MSISVTFPFAGITQNVCYRISGSRMYMSAPGKEFKERVHATCPKVKLEGNVMLDIKFYFATKHRRDLDNYLKIFLDSIKNVIIEDDSKIMKIICEKIIGTSDKISLTVTQV